MTKSQSVIAIFICLSISLGLGFFMNYNFKKYKTLKETGIEVEATIKRIYKKSTGRINNKESFSPFMEYSFKAKNGAIVKGGHFISNNDEQSLMNDRNIMITYLPSKPSINQSTESLQWKSQNNIFVFIIYAIIGVCIIGIFFNIRNLCR